MKKVLTLSALTLLLSSFTTQADEGEVILGLDLGIGKMSIDDEFVVVDSEYKNHDSFSASYVGGYHFGSDIVAEANIVYSSNNSIFNAVDQYELFELKAMAGYSFQLTPAFSVVPLIGLSRWDLDTKQGALLNPGPEAKEEFSGTDMAYKIRFNIAFNSVVSLSLSYSMTDADFGRIQATQAGVLFEF